MPRGKLSTSSRFSGPKGWRRNAAFTVASLVVLFGAAYAMRCTLLLNIARIFLSRDADLLAQERKDGVTIGFASTPSAWVKPMKNLMNPIWLPIQAEGVNYFTFAAPGNLFRSFSERSNPTSPYYQAWVGGYVTKRRDGTLPADLPLWASEVTALDQRSWLAAMGDPMPVADFGAAAPMGNITIDGRDLQLWHGSMQSHSDFTGKHTSTTSAKYRKCWGKSLCLSWKTYPQAFPRQRRYDCGVEPFAREEHFNDRIRDYRDQ